MRRRLLALAAAVLLVLLPVWGGTSEPAGPAESDESQESVESAESAEAEGSAEANAYRLPKAFVYVSTATVEGFLPLPEREEDSYTYPLTQIREDGTYAVNNIRVTPDGVFMESATCDNQDCVNQGMLTLENREFRPLGNFIICLPHQVWLSLYTPEEVLAMVEQ